MDTHKAYYRLSQFAFLLAASTGMDFALSYLRLNHVSNWLTWQTGAGMAVLFAAMVMCYVGQVWSYRDAADSARFFPWCLAAFIVACVVGLNGAMSYLHLVRSSDWPAWRPGVGVALLFVSMLLSYIGYALAVQRARQSPSSVAA